MMPSGDPMCPHGNGYAATCVLCQGNAHPAFHYDLPARFLPSETIENKCETCGKATYGPHCYWCMRAELLAWAAVPENMIGRKLALGWVGADDVAFRGWCLEQGGSPED